MSALGVLLLCLCQVTVLLVIFVFLGIPLLIALFPNIMVKMFFLNFRRIPMTDYMNVSANNVRSIGRAFYLHGQEGNIGVWHMLPKSMSADYREKGIHPDDEEMERSLSLTQYPIVLYLHGNSFDRTIAHRVELYNLLNKLDYHVVTFDYRGYGDSEGNPSEPGLVNDSRLVYDYVKSHAKDNAIVVWGHSMGSGVSTKLVMDLSMEGIPPHGLVLESPFNNLRDAIMNHLLSIPIRWMPESMVQRILIQPLREVNLKMETDKRIKAITCPILILHAENDHVIPVFLARKLRDAALAASRDVKYVEFDEDRNYQHKFIYMAPELSTLLPTFIEHSKEIASQRGSLRSN
nr:Alpha beta hydrolase fold-1 domain containing protein [Haemonchus contortus]